MDTIMKISELIRQDFYPEIDWKQEQETGRTNYSAFFASKLRKYPDKPQDDLDKVFTVL
jgi:hypothetical protein